MSLTNAERKREQRAARALLGRPRLRGGKHADPFGAPFLFWDSEGVTYDEGTARARHCMTLLANSDGAFIEPIVGEEKIRTVDALHFLVSHGGGRNAARRNNVIFVGGYDVNKILSDLSRADLARVWSGKRPDGTEDHAPYRIGERLWNITYRSRKQFLVSLLHPTMPYKTNATGKRVSNIEASINLWDVWGFFQSSFVVACERNLTVEQVARHGLERIAEMKAKRADFSRESPESVRAYCFQELSAGVALMDTVRAQLREADIRIARWDGAGAIAKAILQKRGIKSHREETSEGMRPIVASAYGGGRIEIACIGRHRGLVADYDLQSAYPSSCIELPSLTRAHWALSSDPTHSFAVVHLRWIFPPGLPWYPLPFRERSGTRLYPRAGEGWFWKCEADAALAFARQMGGRCDVVGAWNLVSDTGERPFSFVPELFEQRAKWKREGRGGEKMLKLGLNSVYGALAQQVGRGPYFQLEWAGWITAATRARLVLAALTDPAAVIMFATDGIFCTRALPLECRAGLGEWERRDAAEIVVAQAGVYWYRCVRGCGAHPRGMRWHSAYRGFDRAPMRYPGIVTRAWRRGASSVEVSATRFVSMGSAVRSDASWRAWGTWVRALRSLDVSGYSEKRVYDLGTCGPWDPANRLVPLRPREVLDGVCSAPYPVEAWGMPWMAPDERFVEADDYDALEGL